MENETFDLQVDEWADGPLTICVIIRKPGSFACFSGAPQVTGECETLEEFDEEIDRAISELEKIRVLGHQTLSKSSK